MRFLARSPFPALLPDCDAADARAEADQAIRRLEVPDAGPQGCGCAFRHIPCDCPEYRRLGDCSHPPRYMPPCAHVLSIDPDAFPLSFAEWQQLLRGRHPDVYAWRPCASAATISLTRQSRVNALVDRETFGEQLWNRDDLFRDPDPDVSRKTRHCRNGRDDDEENLEARPVWAPPPAERKIG